MNDNIIINASDVENENSNPIGMNTSTTTTNSVNKATKIADTDIETETETGILKDLKINSDLQDKQVCDINKNLENLTIDQNQNKNISNEHVNQEEEDNNNDDDDEYDTDETNSEDDENRPGNIYIRGLLPTTDSDELFNIFKPYGNITSCKIIYDEFNNSKCFGFINFENRKMSKLSIKNLNNKNINGNLLFINHHISKIERLKQLEFEKLNFKSLYIKNLPRNYDLNNLKSIFGKFGKISSITSPSLDSNNNNKSNSNRTNYAFINFKDHQSAANAKNSLNNYEIEKGYKIIINRAEKKSEKLSLQYLNKNNLQNLNNSDLSGNTNNNNNNNSNYRRKFSTNNNQNKNRFVSNRNIQRNQEQQQYQQGFAPPVQAVNIGEPGSSSDRIPEDLSGNKITPSSSGFPGAPISQIPVSQNSSLSLHSPLLPSLQQGQQQGLMVPPALVNGNLENPSLPPFIITPDSNIIETATGMPIAGPQFQDSNLYIKNLPLNYDDKKLQDMFEKFGVIVSAKVMTYNNDELKQLLAKENEKQKSKDAENEIVKGANDDEVAEDDEEEDEYDEDDEEIEVITDSSENEKRSDTITGDIPFRSKGFGFVCFQKPIEASMALVAMDKYELDPEHVLQVSFAQRKENRIGNRGTVHHYTQNHLQPYYNLAMAYMSNSKNMNNNNNNSNLNSNSNDNNDNKSNTPNNNPNYKGQFYQKYQNAGNYGNFPGQVINQTASSLSTDNNSSVAPNSTTSTNNPRMHNAPSSPYYNPMFYPPAYYQFFPPNGYYDPMINENGENYSGESESDTDYIENDEVEGEFAGEGSESYMENEENDTAENASFKKSQKPVHKFNIHSNFVPSSYQFSNNNRNFHNDRNIERQQQQHQQQQQQQQQSSLPASPIPTSEIPIHMYNYYNPVLNRQGIPLPLPSQNVPSTIAPVPNNGMMHPMPPMPPMPQLNIPMNIPPNAIMNMMNMNRQNPQSGYDDFPNSNSYYGSNYNGNRRYSQNSKPRNRKTNPI